MIERNGKSKLDQKLQTSASQDNGIKRTLLLLLYNLFVIFNINCLLRVIGVKYIRKEVQKRIYTRFSADIGSILQ